MRRGVDTNVLIYALMPGLPQHETVRRFLLDHLAQEDMTLILTPGRPFRRPHGTFSTPNCQSRNE